MGPDNGLPPGIDGKDQPQPSLEEIKKAVRSPDDHQVGGKKSKESD